MRDESRGPATIDLSTPNVARMYDYYLGGKENFPADREAAEQVLALAPQAPILARQNRAFLGRAVRFLAQAGIRQFLDIGAGLPTQDNVHEAAQRVAPDARVVYVDNDPVACLHARALLARPNTAVVQADLRRPEEIIGHPEVRRLIDFGQPVGLLFVSVLHCLTDDQDPAGHVARFREAMVPASYLVVSHITAADHAEAAERAAGIYKKVGATSQMTLRTREQILGFFDGLDLVEPGLVALPEWHPKPAVGEITDSEQLATWFSTQYKLPTWYLCGVGHKSS